MKLEQLIGETTEYDKKVMTELKQPKKSMEMKDFNRLVLLKRMAC